MRDVRDRGGRDGRSTTGDPAPWRGEAELSASGRRFQLLEIVGRGSFGDVYLAEQHSGAGFRRKVVLKLLNDDVARIRGAARRMRDEARILGLLSHRHIVAVHDLVRVDDRWAILMDYVPGADLERVLEALRAVRGTFPVPAALEVGAAIFDALDFATNADDGKGGRLAVIHRDIKPSNVRLTADGDVKVLDFGVARFSHESRETETRASAWIGTERYMSPERLLREGDAEPGDVYAAASTVVELLLGQPLGRSPIVADRHAAFVEAALVQIRPKIDAEPHVVSRVITALGRGLRADPALRPEARELSRELEALARRVRGPSLREFARELVPRADALLGYGPMPASGVLVEGTGESGPHPEEGVGTVDLSAAEASFFDEDNAPTTFSTWGPGRALTVTTVLVLCAIAGLGLGRALVSESDIRQWVPTFELTEIATDPLPALATSAVTGAAAVTFPDAAVITLDEATSLRVTCGEVSAVGTTEVRLVGFPPGRCTVEASWLQDSYRSELELAPGATVRCLVEHGALGCS